MGATPLTITRVASFIDRQKGAMIVGYVDLKLEENYPNDGSPPGGCGWDLAIAEVNPNLTTVYWYDIKPVEDVAAPFRFVWDLTNGSLRVFAHDGEAANSLDTLHDVTVRLKYEGI